MEVPSPIAGTLSEIVAAEGETVGVDALLAIVSEGAASDAPAAQTPSAPAAAPKGGASVDVMVPTLGESVSEATVSTWFKKVGDTVAQDEMLCELETDKVSVEVPSPAAGTIIEIIANEGDTVDAKAKLAVISSGAGATASAPASEVAPAPAAAPASTGGKDVEDAPSAKKAMAEAGLNRDQVTGSGRDGRVMKDDVAKALAAGKTAQHQPQQHPVRPPLPMTQAAKSA